MKKVFTLAEKCTKITTYEPKNIFICELFDNKYFFY